jgi:AcrR family transcriptional regulator
VSNVSTVPWRDAKRELARQKLLDAAWAAVRENGLAGLSIRDLAQRAGMTTPTVYAYFESKHHIYDAMFGQAAEDFANHMTAPHKEGATPREVLTTGLRRFIDFCVTDHARYQLLFQRTIPDFAPSEASFAPAQRALQSSRDRLALNGVRKAAHVDMWTALTTGLVDQQISNDPGGTRWTRLVDDFISMFLNFVHAERTKP